MAAKKPVLHGRDHRPGGLVDPIPGLGYKQEQIGDNTGTAIGNSAAGLASWGASSALLDVSTPTQPTVLAGGIYAIAAMVFTAGAMTIGGQFQLFLELDAGGDDAQSFVTVTPATATLRNPLGFVALTYHVPAGGVLKLNVNNHDGATQTFQTAIVVQAMFI